jgi:hypothetical protein
MEEIKILTAENLEEILNFEMAKLPGEGIEREISSWHAPWRKEALEHYIPRGWSFAKRVDGKVVGYVIAQPLLFFKSWTQVLWVEHVSAETEAIGVEMIMIAYRWAKDKHLQKVYFSKNLPFSNAINFCNVNEDENLIYLNTTRM